jgi:hypothetical protein
MNPKRSCPATANVFGIAVLAGLRSGAVDCVGAAAFAAVVGAPTKEAKAVAKGSSQRQNDGGLACHEIPPCEYDDKPQ